MKISSMAGVALMAASMSVAAPDPNFHIYIAFGQSNMEGQGNIEQQDKTVDSRFQVMWSGDNGSCVNRTKGSWYDATPPLASCDGKLGPADYFGRTMVESVPEGVKVGVIVVAVAGCDIQLFEKDNYKSYVSTAQSWMASRINNYGGNPYGRMVEMAKKAQEVGVIKGFLLHQGETNSGQNNWPSRVKAIYDNLIKDLGLDENTPLVAGEVHPNGSCKGMNSIIAQLPQQSKNFYVASADGITGMLQDGQSVHFDAAGYRTLGKRYAEKMLSALGEIKVEGGEAPASSSSEAAPASSDASAGSSSAKADAPASSSAVESSAESASSSSDVAPASSSEAAPQSSSGTDGVKVSSLKAASVGKVRFVENLVQVPVVLDRAARVNVGIYSVLGKRVANFDSMLKAGENSVSFDRKMLPAGNYMMSVQVGSERAIVKVNIPR